VSAAGRLALAGRRRAEAIMVDQCTIRPITGHGPADPDTGVVPTLYGAALYAGKCKIQTQKPFPSSPDAGEHLWTVGPLYLHLPVVGSENVATGHEVQITASADPANVGRIFRVKSGDRKTYATAYRPLVEEVT
jgi:hypothetical protein